MVLLDERDVSLALFAHESRFESAHTWRVCVSLCVRVCQYFCKLIIHVGIHSSSAIVLFPFLFSSSFYRSLLFSYKICIRKSSYPESLHFFLTNKEKEESQDFSSCISDYSGTSLEGSVCASSSARRSTSLDWRCREAGRCPFSTELDRSEVFSSSAMARRSSVSRGCRWTGSREIVMNRIAFCLQIFHRDSHWMIMFWTMTIFCLDILLHGIVPALTGGFYYDLYTTPLANTVHIYLWICFMALPLLLYLVSFSMAISVWRKRSTTLSLSSASSRLLVFYPSISIP